MKNSSTIKHISFVAFSNIIKLISSILIGFVIPNILGLTNYGYYKVFILYLTYIGLFHFGFIDGIYLKYGGKDYNQLDKIKFRSFFKFLLYLEVSITIIGIVLTLLFVDGEKKIIFLLLFLNLVALNLTTFYQFISQITSRFKEYSTRLIILSITNILIVAFLYFAKISDFRIYIGLIVAVNYMLLFWYIYTYKDITFGEKSDFSENKADILYFFKLGIPLLLANLASLFVVTVDKQIVEILFPVEVFGVYSFAYSMLAMITVVVSAVGVVLYPTLKKTNLSNLPKNYAILNRVIIILVLVGLIGYFPLLWIIPKYLSDYENSLLIFRIALPGLVLTSSISAIKLNFFKIFNKNMVFFIIGVVIIALNIGLNLVAYHFYGTTSSIAISSNLGIFVWYIITEIYMIRVHHVKWLYNSFIILIGVISFYLITAIENYFLAFLLYGFVVLILVSFNAKSILSLYKNKKENS